MKKFKFKRTDLILDLYVEFGKVGVWYCDKITGEEEVSEEWAQMIGYHAEELNPMSDEKFISLIHPDDLKTSLPKIIEFYNGSRNTYENEFRFRHPKGLIGDEIHYMSKIIAVADVFDALQSDRSYRCKMERDEIITILRAGSGKHFEPELVEVCCEMLYASGK